MMVKKKWSFISSQHIRNEISSPKAKCERQRQRGKTIIDALGSSHDLSDVFSIFSMYVTYCMVRVAQL